MKLLEKPQVSFDGGITISLKFPISERKEVEPILSTIDTFSPDTEYNLSLTKVSPKRSLDANSYAWVLMGKIAKATGRKVEDIYREEISYTGNYIIHPVAEEDMEHWKKLWESKGKGWIVDDIGPCKNFDGYRNTMCWYGSSEYTKEQMNHFLDIIKQDCEALDIETKTPNEIKELTELWQRQR